MWYTFCICLVLIFEMCVTQKWIKITYFGLQNMTKSQLWPSRTMDGLGSKGHNVKQQHMKKLNIVCDIYLYLFGFDFGDTCVSHRRGPKWHLLGYTTFALQNVTKKSQLWPSWTMDGLGSKGHNVKQQHMKKLNVVRDIYLYLIFETHVCHTDVDQNDIFWATQLLRYKA